MRDAFNGGSTCGDYKLDLGAFIANRGCYFQNGGGKQGRSGRSMSFESVFDVKLAWTKR